MPEQNNIQETTQQEVVPVQQEVVAPVQEEKKGLTTGQKFAGGAVIGFAIGGIVWLILSIVKGVKWLINKAKEKFKKTEPTATQTPAPAAAEPAAAPAAEPEKKEAEQPTPEQK